MNMKRNLFKIIFSLLSICMLVAFPSQAISFTELQNDSQTYIPFLGETRNVYLQTNSISIVRYEPPFYILGATIVICDFEQDLIGVVPIRFSYDYRRSNEEILKALPESIRNKKADREHAFETIKEIDEIVRKQKLKNSGVSYSYYSGATFYDLDGNFFGERTDVDQSFHSCKYDSRYYWVAVRTFDEIYNTLF